METTRQAAKGFTLIELMIVIAIVAILVALAVPAYQDYTIRAKVAECVAASAPVKTSISEFRFTMGTYPTNMAQAGIYEDNSNNISDFCDYFLYNNARGPMGDFAVEVDTAAIGGSIASFQLVMVMSPVMAASGSIDWQCTRGWGDIEALKYMPANCRAPNIYQ